MPGVKDAIAAHRSSGPAPGPRASLSWQIVPRRFMELIGDRDPRTVKAVMDAMLKMVKLDVAALEKAHREA